MVQYPIVVLSVTVTLALQVRSRLSTPDRLWRLFTATNQVLNVELLIYGLPRGYETFVSHLFAVKEANQHCFDL